MKDNQWSITPGGEAGNARIEVRAYENGRLMAGVSSEFRPDGVCELINRLAEASGLEVTIA